MTIDELLERIRSQQKRSGDAKTNVLVYTTGAHGFFAGQLLDVASPEAILLRQDDGTEVLIFRSHVVAIATPGDDGA